MKKKNYEGISDVVSTDEINIYSEDGRELLLEDDELSSVEEAFMKGYSDAV